MILEEIKSIIPELQNEKRFFKIDGEKTVWYYDSFSHSLLSVPPVLSELLNSKDPHEKFLSLSVSQGAEILGLCRMIKNNSKDIVAPLQPDKKCVAMINTSNRCNLNCSYCFRDKKNTLENDIQTIKKTINYVMTKYKPDAAEYVFSYSLSSESSIDLSLLEQIADEYINFENYQFYESDFKTEGFDDFYNRLKNDLDKQTDIIFPEKDIGAVCKYLNNLLGNRKLFELLNMSESMFQGYDINEVRKRMILAKWRVYRLNRWAFEIKYDRYINKRNIPYVGFWFMSNGTCSSQRFIDFVKSCNINPLLISIDGPKEVHDYNRKFYDKNGSYDEILKNIKIYLQNDIKLKASVVITSRFPKPLAIIKHLLSIGFSQIAMTPVRPGTECSFYTNNVEKLLSGYDELFDELARTAVEADFRLFHLLKEDLTLAAFYSFINRIKMTKRCPFDEQLVVNGNGEIYPCQYFNGNKDFCYGNIDDGIDESLVNHNILVTQRGNCSECWARYLCGGTCFYGSYKFTGNYVNIDPIECTIKKHLAEKCMKLLVFLYEHNISLDKIK